jgi:NAD(P)-dependent dehydrogenase (short-subunit alcohol dehydrogenase family)
MRQTTTATTAKTAPAERRHALVLGGTGAIGSAVLRCFARAGLRTTFTYSISEEKARGLAAESGHTAEHVDLADPAEIRALYTRLDARGAVPDVLVHCATARLPMAALEQTTPELLDGVCRVAGCAALVGVQEMARRLATEKRAGHVVLVGALDRAQSLPLSVAFAAAQGMLGAMTMALAKELGPRGVRVNLVAGGPTGSGISARLAPALIADYEKLSGLRRLGTPEEIAACVAFLALENEYMTGKVLTANGGL